ncbi:MAG: RluA family pseudouridine synthase [Oscillospiraceae bacterium]|nr:RluA family pseudouridine synthase [Oscillospiraceae bacterium]
MIYMKGERAVELIYQDKDIVVCIKPAGVKSTDEPGGVPELVREALGDPNANVRTVHRLDQVVSGLMVLARNARSASELSRQIRDGEFGKAYLAVVHGELPASGTMTDLLLRNKAERKTYVVTEPGKDVQEAVLDYTCLDRRSGMSKVHIILRTGRTHQIRCQFSSRGYPLVGDRKYSLLEDGCPIALWSAHLSFTHPKTGEKMSFSQEPPNAAPWSEFAAQTEN